MAAPKTKRAAEDPVSVDSKHYKVEFENERVRVLRVNYAGHEKSVMHGHPASVAVFLTSNRVKFNLPDGNSEERSWHSGESMFISEEEHLPENLTGERVEVVLIELKS